MSRLLDVGMEQLTSWEVQLIASPDPLALWPRTQELERRAAKIQMQNATGWSALETPALLREYRYSAMTARAIMPAQIMNNGVAVTGHTLTQSSATSKYDDDVATALLRCADAHKRNLFKCVNTRLNQHIVDVN